MKKLFLILSATLILCCLVFIAASCTSEAVVQTDTDFAINEIYLAAQELGFDGTLEEFLNFVKGSDGIGIKNVYMNDEGILTVVLTDETVYTLGNVKGTDGKDGDDGLSITSADIDENGFLILTFSDGTSINCGDVCGEDGEDGLDGTDGEQGVQGEKGEDGRGIEKLYVTETGLLVAVFTDSDDEVIIGKVSGETGEQGKPGNGIDSVTVSENGNLIIVLDDGTRLDCGNIKGKDGKDGEQGEQGIQGEKGEQGEQGIQGEKGEQGEQGIQGEKGDDGLSAYEIYLKYHPEYTGSEAQWIDDLVNGNLASGGNDGTETEQPEEVVKHTVDIYCGDRKYTQLVEDGKTIDFGTVDKILSGYEFLYWESDGKVFAENTPVKGNITVEAVYRALKPDYTEVADLWETMTISANERYRIVVSDICAYNLQGVTFYSDSGKTEFELLLNGEAVEKLAFESGGRYCDVDLTQYAYTEGYILDIWFVAESGATLSVTPIS